MSTIAENETYARGEGVVLSPVRTGPIRNGCAWRQEVECYSLLCASDRGRSSVASRRLPEAEQFYGFVDISGIACFIVVSINAGLNVRANTRSKNRGLASNDKE